MVWYSCHGIAFLPLRKALAVGPCTLSMFLPRLNALTGINACRFKTFLSKLSKRSCRGLAFLPLRNALAVVVHSFHGKTLLSMDDELVVALHSCHRETLLAWHDVPAMVKRSCRVMMLSPWLDLLIMICHLCYGVTFLSRHSVFAIEKSSCCSFLGKTIDAWLSCSCMTFLSQGNALNMTQCLCQGKMFLVCHEAFASAGVANLAPGGLPSSTLIKHTRTS